MKQALRRLFVTNLMIGSVTALWSRTAVALGRPPILKIGQEVPPVVSYDMVDGSPIDFERFKGAPYAIYLGADWCPPCNRARPTALAIAKKYKDRGIKLIILLSDPEKRREANQKLASEHGIFVGMQKKELCPPDKCRFGIEGGAWNSPKGAITLPSAYLIDKNGIVRHYLEGPDRICDDMEKELQKVMELV
jgi:thiol-disulfide isomerase/thioredoxin